MFQTVRTLTLPRPFALRGLGSATAAALALTSGFLCWLADYPRPIALLAWVAPVPVLVAALRRGPRDTLWLGALWGLGATAATWQALDPLAFPVPAAIAMVAGRTAMMTAVLAVTAALAGVTSISVAGWVFACATALAEWTTQPGGLGLWWTTATTQVSVGWLRGTAAVGGPFLVSLLVALGNGTLAVLVMSRQRAALGAALLAALTIGAAALAGARAAPVATRSARVAAVVHALPPDVAERWDRRTVRSEETRAALDAYEGLTRRAAAGGARVVVWPEYGVFVRGADVPAWQTRVAALARDTRTVVVAGFVDVDARRNSVLLATSTGETSVYSKQRLVPGMETSWIEPGDRLFGETADGDLRVATRICYDAAFTDGSRAAARAGVDLLAVAGRHWRGIEEVYPMWQVYRAAENRLAMVQAVRDGSSMIVDPAGRVVAAASSFDRPEVLLVADVPLARPGTLYTRAGDWPVALAALGLLAIAACAARASWRGPQGAC
jgi:apolipoprotein N-acyltransferase